MRVRAFFSLALVAFLASAFSSHSVANCLRPAGRVAPADRAGGRGDRHPYSCRKVRAVNMCKPHAHAATVST
jgi:hypothetical protein